MNPSIITSAPTGKALRSRAQPDVYSQCGHLMTNPAIVDQQEMKFLKELWMR